MELRYFSGEYTAGSDWQEISVEDRPERALKSVTVANDDSTNYILVKINDFGATEIKIPAREVVGLDIPVMKVFYRAPTGSPKFRVICD